MKNKTHLQLKDARNMTDERVFKVLLECFEHDQLLSHRLHFPVTLREKRREYHGTERHGLSWLQASIARHTGK